jgi:hypothetical protein
MASIPSSFNRGFAPGARAAVRQKKYAFTPYNPTVPTGSYDPGLDSALYAAQRGLQDTTADTALGGQRALADYGLSRDSVIQGRDRTLADLAQSSGRNTEDYNRSVAMLVRQYGQLGNTQRQSAISRGVVHGGSLLQAAAKRTANEAIDQQPLDIGQARQLQDYATQTGRVGQDANTQLGQLALAYQRGDTDAGTALLRAQREASQFGVDTQSQKLFQASQAGYVAPPRPSNEFTSASGTPYRVIKQGNQRFYVDQYGRRLSQRPA